MKEKDATAILAKYSEQEMKITEPVKLSEKMSQIFIICVILTGFATLVWFGEICHNHAKNRVTTFAS